MTNNIADKAKFWTSSIFDNKTIDEVQELIDNNNDALTEAFYKDLEFGTGGLRGIMGVGTNRINKYTIGQATQGLCNYIRSQNIESPSVAIAYDSRNNSPYFAQITAEVCTANGIKVYLYEALRPTPLLSYTIRELGCTAGVVLTASHNPKEYNGYKVYWSDGGQLVPPQDKAIINEVRAVSFDKINWEFDQNLIQKIGKELDNKYIKQALSLQLDSSIKKEKEELKIVYTSLHGTGITIIPQMLIEAGYNSLEVLKAQENPDGKFPTVESPNPEEAAALELALNKAKEIDADIVLGTDPDTDRVGIAVKNLNGEIELLNGNQTAALLTYYVLTKSKPSFKGNEYICKTIVTTTLLDEIAKGFNLETINTLTGFKWIAEQIRLNTTKKYIVGGEESYGYLVGDFVRDKDAASSALLLCEMVAWTKSQGSSPYELLIDIYEKYGYFKEHLISIKKEGKSGAEEIAKMMDNFRNNPPSSLGDIKVKKVADYLQSKENDIITNQTKDIQLPKSNVIQFTLEDGSKVTARPSGTEPKIKFYFSVKSDLQNKSEYDNVSKLLDVKIEKIISSLLN